MNILIIEENDSLGKVLEKTFRDRGFEVALIRDGVAGLNQMRVAMPKVVILDMDLPSLNGFEILEIRAKEPELMKIPVIVVSNSTDPAELTRLSNLGISDHVVKVAMTPEEVYAKVATALGMALEGDTDEPRELAVDTGYKIQEKVDLTGVFILWIEDDMFLASIVGRKLTTSGAKYLQAKSGEEAFTILEKEKPQIIVLDLMLPGMNGFEILEKIKASDSTKDIPVIVLSNLDQRDDMEKCFKLGANKFFVKALVTLDRIFEEIKGFVKK